MKKLFELFLPKPKLCISCRWVKVPKPPTGIYKCTNIEKISDKTISLVDGEVIYDTPLEHCYNVRSKEGRCGPRARHFEPIIDRGRYP